VKARLYAIPASHPAFAAELMLERKGIEYSRVDLPQWFHRGLLRALRFRGRTVPALVLDGRAKVEAIERWVDGDVQQYCRRLVYWALPRHPEAVGSYLEGSNLILPMFMVKPLAPTIVRILRRDHKATDDAVRADLSALPAILDRLDQAVADGVIGGAEPNVADLQVACSLALLMTHDDLREYIAARPSGKLAERLAAGYPGRMPAAFPADWLPA
jgi:glutathione S-transferase